MTLVSVIVPAYNSEKYLKTCLDSILGQTRKPDQVIIVDDCSVDGTLEIAKEYEKKFENGFTILRNTVNSGIGFSRKAGVEFAEGNYLTFLSSDDVWEPNFLEKMLDYAKAHPNQILYCRTKIISSNGEIYSETPEINFQTQSQFVKETWDAARKYKMFVNFSGILIPKQVFQEINFNENDRIGEDYRFLLESISLHEIPYHHVNLALIQYRVHESMTTQLQWSKIIENDNRIIQETKQKMMESNIKIRA